MQRLSVFISLVCACVAQMVEVNEHSWKAHLGDQVELFANTSGTWKNDDIYKEGNNTVELLRWRFGDTDIPCGKSGDIIVSKDCENLTIPSVQRSHGGFYYVMMNVTRDGSTQEYRVMRALNINGPIYKDMFNDFYLEHIRVASISAGSVLGTLMLAAIINHFRYSSREERQHGKDRPTSSGETTF